MLDFLSIFSTPGIGEIALVAVFIFQSIILLGLLIGSNWHWRIKSFTTLISGLIFALTYFSIIDMQGWPTPSKMPDNIEYLSHYVDPPNKRIGKDGFIVVWMLYLENKIGKKPRAFQFPYSKEFHKKLEQAKKAKGENGRNRVGIILKKIKKGKLRPDSTYKDSIIYNMPTPELPTK